jgi:hypothetical protein
VTSLILFRDLQQQALERNVRNPRLDASWTNLWFERDASPR